MITIKIQERFVSSVISTGVVIGEDEILFEGNVMGEDLIP
jgi:hypothetical protein